MAQPKAKPNHRTFRIVAVLTFALVLTAAAVVYADFEIQPGAAISQTNEAAVIKVMAVGRDDLYDTASQANLNFHVKVRGRCDDSWKVGSATVTIKGKVHHLTVNKSLEYIGSNEGQQWSFQVATFPYIPPDTQSSPVAMCNAELERRLARGDSKAEVLSKGFEMTAPHAYDAELSVACIRKKTFWESYHYRPDTKLPATISCQPTGYKVERTPGTPQRTPGTPQRTPGAPQRTPGAPKRTPVPPAQTSGPERFATASLPNPQLAFVDSERFEANGTRWTRYKLSVTNRASFPDSLWQASANLPACGNNQNASRTWVEIFGSPGDERLTGFCSLRSSEDLAQLWFAIPAGDKGPPCVYIVMTDRSTGKKYESNRVCSRLFPSVVGGIRSSSGQTKQEDRRNFYKGWIELNSTQINEAANVKGGSGSDKIFNASHGSTVPSTDSGKSTKELKGATANTGVPRDQMAALIMRAKGEPNPPPPSSQRFTDVPPENPFYAFIDRVAALRIIQACGRGKFCPEEPVTREQFAAFIVRATGTSNPPPPATQRFVDVPPTSPFYGFIDLTASRKLIDGCEGNNFCPKEPVTLDEADAALRKAFPSNNSAGPKVSGQQKSSANIQGGTGWDSISSVGPGSAGSGVPTDKKAGLAQPDLTIRQFLFPPTNDKALRVRVVNTGQGPSAACRLVLTVRKINGVAVGRTTHVNVPALAAGADDWLHIDVKSILPNNVSLQSTTFRLNVDATELVAELNETNNEVWHNK